jgi:hypothetical protein
MKKEINPAILIGLVVVILAGVAAYFVKSTESPQLPSIRRGSVKTPSAGGNAAKSNASGG